MKPEWECPVCHDILGGNMKRCQNCGTEKPESEAQITTLEVSGHCGQCGIVTYRWDIKWQMYICEKHDAAKVAESIYEHVMFPNA